MLNLTLIRGLPGSGKSTLARLIENGRMDIVHIETDMYFISQSGMYVFDASKLKEAHAWCLEQTCFHLNKGKHVIVANTFSQLWEMEPYLSLPVPVQVIECYGNFRSVHDVPAHTIERMKQRWERYAGA